MTNFAGFREKLKNIKTTRLLALNFIIVIVIGSFLLSLPFSNKIRDINFIEHLFTAVSATCVTGLLTVTVVEQYTIFGQIVLIFLMQIGGLGLMTFLITFIVLSKNQLFFAEKKLVQDALNKPDIDNIPYYIKNIIKYTLFIEILGAFILCFRFIPEFGFLDGIFKAIFLSVSAFCNAGIDNLTNNSLGNYKTDVLVMAVVSMLIITGGLGFAVWFDFSHSLKKMIKKKTSLKFMVQHFSLNTKIVLKITTILILSGAIIFFLIESFNAATMLNYSFFDRIVISLFNSVTLRTAGFSSINIGLLKNATLLAMCLYMFIGGSPGGTAGGIKTTTFALLILSVKAMLKNNDYINYQKREINRNIVSKAFIIFTVYLVSVFMAIFILLLTDEKLNFMPLLFEVVSAIATVGLSSGITPLLSYIGKIVIMIMMFIGRVGPITIILSGFNDKTIRGESIRFAQEDVLIG